MSNKGNRKLVLATIIILILLAINSDRILNFFSPSLPNKIETITVYSKTFTLEIASTTEAMERGLSGRNSLAKNMGMLFVLGQPRTYGFWMKDMNFPIDIVWLDKNKEILGLTKNLQPNSYPKIFYSPSGTAYALEINTGIIN